MDATDRRRQTWFPVQGGLWGRMPPVPDVRASKNRAASACQSPAGSVDREFAVRSFLASGGEVLEPEPWLSDLSRLLEGRLVAGGVGIRLSPKVGGARGVGFRRML